MQTSLGSGNGLIWTLLQACFEGDKCPRVEVLGPASGPAALHSAGRTEAGSLLLLLLAEA